MCSELLSSIMTILDEMPSGMNSSGMNDNILWFMTIFGYNRLLIYNQVKILKRVCFLTSIKCWRSKSVGCPCPAQTIHMTSYSARVGEGKRVNKRAEFFKR